MYNGTENRILNIMTVLALQEKLKTIPEQRYFSKIDDKGTDESNKEQLSFCLRAVDENLNAFEDVISFYWLEIIKSDTMNLSLSNCRGQTYDGASNMVGKKSGVLTQVLGEQPKVLPYTVKDIPSVYQWKQWLKNVATFLEKFAYSWSFHQNENIY